MTNTLTVLNALADNAGLKRNSQVVMMSMENLETNNGPKRRSKCRAFLFSFSFSTAAIAEGAGV